MKYKLFCALLSGSVLLMGCGSDNDDGPEPVPPPASDAVDISEATSINVNVDTFDGASGVISFSLTDGDAKAITQATDYDITYFGYPDPDAPSSQPKAWKRWHVTQSFTCDVSEQSECLGVLTESDTEGHYTFDAIDLDLDGKAAYGSVELYKVAIQIHGAQASNEIELIPAD